MHMKKCGVPLGEHYLDDTAVRSMILSLSYAVQQLLKKTIASSGSFLSLLIDESTDSSNQSKLLLVLRYCEGVQPKEVYFGISTLPKADAKTIFDKAWNALESEGFVLNKLILVLGDNAPTI